MKFAATMASFLREMQTSFRFPNTLSSLLDLHPFHIGMDDIPNPPLCRTLQRDKRLAENSTFIFEGVFFMVHNLQLILLRKEKIKRLTLMALILPFSVPASASPTPEVPVRPPQYVAISFDGSLNLGMWEETRAKARELQSRFTYFISGVYFISQDERRELYYPPGPPRLARGASAITYSKTGEDARVDIAHRLDQVRMAMNEGAEIGSHDNGHWDGSKWSFEGWQSEIRQFHHFIEDNFQIHPSVSKYTSPALLKSQPQWQQDWKQDLHKMIRGHRAPLLAYNKGMFEALKEKGYTFDASTTGDQSEWPHLIDGLWRFHLSSIPVDGTARKTLSMDYNFYYFDSKGQPDPGRSSFYAERYYRSLMKFFLNNYYGSRAPMDIGNHFTPWNNGAYFDGLMKFISKVCHNNLYPETQCLNYSSLIEKLNQAAEAGRLASWKAQKFPRAPRPDNILMAKWSSPDLELSLDTHRNSRGELLAKIGGRDALQFLQKGIWTVNLFRAVPKANPHHDSPSSRVLGEELKSTEILFQNLQKGIDLGSTFGENLTGRYFLQVALHDSQKLFGKNANLGPESEVLTSTHEVYLNHGRILGMAPTEWEERALKGGDLPEAHDEEIHEQ